MEKAKLERIVQRYYDALEDGKILGRKCTRCGHVEFPPYLACNTCGNLDTEWYEMSGKAMCNQILLAGPAFVDLDFKKQVGDYWIAAIQPENCDEYGSCIINIDPARYDEVYAKLPVPVRPVIVQDKDTKIVLWELDE